MSPDIPLPASVTRPGKGRRIGTAVGLTAFLTFAVPTAVASADTSIGGSPAHHPTLHHPPERGTDPYLIDLNCGPDTTGPEPEVTVPIPYDHNFGKGFGIGLRSRRDNLVRAYPHTKTAEVQGIPNTSNTKTDGPATVWDNGAKVVVESQPWGLDVKGYCAIVYVKPR